MRAIERVLEAYSVTFGIYTEFSLPAGQPVRAIDLAQLLRGAGIPAQAYRLIEPSKLQFPCITFHDGSWKLHLPLGADAYGLPEELILWEPSFEKGTVIVGEPPVGCRFQLLIREDDQLQTDDLDIYVFYAATSDEAKLAEQQLFTELQSMLDQAQQAGREVIFLDAVGLIPEETVRCYGTDEQVAFQKALDAIRQETKGITRGIPIYDSTSSFWSALYRFLAERRVHCVLEELAYDLWRKIVEFDRRNLTEKAIVEFLTGFPDRAAKTMLEHMRGFHDLNCFQRDLNFAHQIEALMTGANRPFILIAREIGHYDVLEGFLGSKYLVHSKILGQEERFTTLLRAPALDVLLVNIGVELSDQDLELIVLHQCVIVSVLRDRVKSLRTAARLLEACHIDELSRQQIREIIQELNDPTHMYLRSQGQDILDQLAYILKDKGVVPSEVIRALEEGAQ